MHERERLVEILGQVQWNAKAEQVADALLKAGVTLPPAPTPRPVWPGLEGEGPRGVQRIADDAWNTAHARGDDMDDCSRAFYTAMAAHLFRALVAGLPDAEAWPNRVWVGNRTVLRRALAALADPYDGGGK